MGDFFYKLFLSELQFNYCNLFFMVEVKNQEMEKLIELVIEREEGWCKLINEQVMLYIFKINLFISKIVVEIEVKLEFFIVKLLVYDWCNLVLCFCREFGKFIDYFFLYFLVNYNLLEER